MVDKPAAQRMIMHSIPKNQIVPDPNAAQPSTAAGVSGQKRSLEESSSNEITQDEGEVRLAKKRKEKRRPSKRGLRQ